MGLVAHTIVVRADKSKVEEGKAADVILATYYAL